MLMNAMIKRTAVALAAVAVFASVSQAGQRVSIRELQVQLDKLQTEFRTTSDFVKDVEIKLKQQEEVVAKLASMLEGRPDSWIGQAYAKAVAERDALAKAFADGTTKLKELQTMIEEVQRTIKEMAG